ncbi:MAG: hypothetical protein C4517_00670 [Stygiobacter sp.]|nr:MAG: hypothetical protein C4517_00670 [Stygiobacter sp.]
MKKEVVSLAILICISSFYFYSCSKDSSSPTSSSNFSGKAVDYFPISSGKIINMRIQAGSTVFDSLGNATNFTQINNESYSCTLGGSTVVRNMNANPLFGSYNNSSTLLGYFAILNGDIIGFSHSSSDPTATILASDLTIGKEWVANPQSPFNRQVKVKLIEALNNYTNSAGQSFNNVINLYISYKDSSNEYHSFSYGSEQKYSKIVVDANLYFAKGIGIVGAKLNNSDQTKKVISKFGPSRRISYRREKTSGMVGIIN